MSNKHSDYPLRYQAVIVVEAETALAVGTGDKNILLDNPIARDAFGLPYLPATSLTGVMRHTLEKFGLDEGTINDIFGYQEKYNDDGHGSRIILSSAHLVAKNKQVADGLNMALTLKNELDELLFFPIREHVRIDHKGVADKEEHGKFESELLPKGTRFAFEIELWGNEADRTNWTKVLNVIAHPFFRIGGGTRKGFGKLKVITVQQRELNLATEGDLELYLDKTTQIQIPTDSSFKKHTISSISETDAGLVHYQLRLTPRDFFLFDGQFEMDIDSDTFSKLENGTLKLADSTPKCEKVIEWSNEIPKISEKKWLIPATSVKGAISHRVAFHFNKLIGVDVTSGNKILEEVQAYIAQLSDPQSEEELKIQQKQIKAYLENLEQNSAFESVVGENNEAVRTLFGEALDSDKKKGQRGRVIFSDVYLDKVKVEEKALNHVAIDRYTGGAVDTALFSEKVVHAEEAYLLDIWVEKTALEADKILKAFEETLRDLVNEKLPLGGGVMRGHGMMKGTITKNNESL